MITIFYLYWIIFVLTNKQLRHIEKALESQVFLSHNWVATHLRGKKSDEVRLKNNRFVFVMRSCNQVKSDHRGNIWYHLLLEFQECWMVGCVIAQLEVDHAYPFLWIMLLFQEDFRNFVNFLGKLHPWNVGKLIRDSNCLKFGSTPGLTGFDEMSVRLIPRERLKMNICSKILPRWVALELKETGMNPIAVILGHVQRNPYNWEIKLIAYAIVCLIWIYQLRRSLKPFIYPWKTTLKELIMNSLKERRLGH